MKMTVYMGDELAAEVKVKLSDQNISAIFQAAVRRELDRTKARAELAEEGFERVELYDTGRRRNVAFKGRKLGEAEDGNGWTHIAYLTPKNKIAIEITDYEEDDALFVYDTYEALVADGNQPDGLLWVVAQALGEEYTQELDI